MLVRYRGMLAAIISVRYLGVYIAIVPVLYGGEYMAIMTITYGGVLNPLYHQTGMEASKYPL
jgi:hypothetical protein